MDMRKILTLLLCSIIFTACAAIDDTPSVRLFVPHSSIVGTKPISERDHIICTSRAVLGHAALTHAKNGLKIEEVRSKLDNIVLSKDYAALNFPSEEVVLYYKIVDIAFTISKEYPTFTPENYGNHIYSRCKYEKTAMLV